MELRDLAAFREVARHGSFTQAAARLGYVQSTVSAQIHSLELDVGAQLFDRLGRTVALTDAGRALLPHAERMLALAASAEAAVAEAAGRDGELTGSISVSAPESLLTYRLPAVLSRFRTLAPKVAINLRPTPVGRFRGETRRGLAAGLVDLAFVLDTPLELPGFCAELLIEESVSVVASRQHRLAALDRAGPKDLDGEALLLPEAPDSGCAYRGQFERQLADGHVTPASALEFSSIETVKQCVVAGMGIAPLLSVAVEAEVTAGTLVRLAWREPFQVQTQVVWSDHRSLTPAMEAFIVTAKRTFTPSLEAAASLGAEGPPAARVPAHSSG